MSPDFCRGEYNEPLPHSGKVTWTTGVNEFIDEGKPPQGLRPPPPGGRDYVVNAMGKRNRALN